MPCFGKLCNLCMITYMFGSKNSDMEYTGKSSKLGH